MQVQDLMTRNPAMSSADSGLAELARLMIEHDCGEIPLYDGEARRLVGVVTDRDIACRAVAGGKLFSDLKARHIMTSPVITIRPTDAIETAVVLMASRQIRRLPVVDDRGMCIGMISEGDLAQHTASARTGELERAITSRPGRFTTVDGGTHETRRVCWTNAASGSPELSR